MIHLDTSTLVDALTVYEWLRGPRLQEELAIREALFPRESTIAFGVEEALGASELCRRVRNPRGREVDLAIAACAMTHDAALWTLNATEFRDIPGLRLYGAG